jgi:hypothetical protein
MKEPKKSGAVSKKGNVGTEYDSSGRRGRFLAGNRFPPQVKKVDSLLNSAQGEPKQKYAAGGMTGMTGMAKGYKKGGSVTRADGICKKGHTKGKMV